MSDGKKYYCFCGSNCKYETMTKEQILAAITQAVSTGSVGDVDTGFVTTVKEKNGGRAVTFWVGTQAQYNALAEKEENCMYIITDSKLDIVAVSHEETDGTSTKLTRFYSDGIAEAWVRYVVNITTPNATGALYTSKIFSVPYPESFINTNTSGMAILCEISLLGSGNYKWEKPLLLMPVSAARAVDYQPRIAIGCAEEIKDETPVYLRMHIAWRWK